MKKAILNINEFMEQFYEEEKEEEKEDIQINNQMYIC
jgi:hypothetical protein